MRDNEQILISLDELCDRLNIGKNSAYKLLNSGKIKCFRIGRIWKIPKDSLDKYINGQLLLNHCTFNKNY